MDKNLPKKRFGKAPAGEGYGIMGAFEVEEV
jgi:hypothetical protein